MAFGKRDYHCRAILGRRPDLRFHAAAGGAGIEPYATWPKLPREGIIAPYNEPENICIVVVGGETNPLWLTTDLWYTVSASIDEWRPKGEVQRDRKLQPAGISVDASCSDGTCELPAAIEEKDKASEKS